MRLALPEEPELKWPLSVYVQIDNEKKSGAWQSVRRICVWTGELFTVSNPWHCHQWAGERWRGLGRAGDRQCRRQTSLLYFLTFLAVLPVSPLCHLAPPAVYHSTQANGKSWWKYGKSKCVRLKLQPIADLPECAYFTNDNNTYCLKSITTLKQ